MLSFSQIETLEAVRRYTDMKGPVNIASYRGLCSGDPNRHNTGDELRVIRLIRRGYLVLTEDPLGEITMQAPLTISEQGREALDKFWPEVYAAVG